MNGERVALQGLRLSIPGDHRLSGLTFVLRSQDSSRWWRDGTSLQLDFSKQSAGPYCSSASIIAYCSDHAMHCRQALLHQQQVYKQACDLPGQTMF